MGLTESRGLDIDGGDGNYRSDHFQVKRREGSEYAERESSSRTRNLLRISCYLAAFVPLFRLKQVHFEGFGLKKAAIECEFGSDEEPDQNDHRPRLCDFEMSL